ncbi:hypothetical protein TNCV_4333441 [Trichonephila clavipes]|nr:hypothetical protein TNCV_4333441 [Trichonephila clavipes]
MTGYTWFHGRFKLTDNSNTSAGACSELFYSYAPTEIHNTDFDDEIAAIRIALSELFFAIRSCFTATRGLLATDHVILNHGQMTWTTPELAPALLTTTPHQREEASQLSIYLTCIAALHGGSLVVLGSNS